MNKRLLLLSFILLGVFRLSFAFGTSTGMSAPTLTLSNTIIDQGQSISFTSSFSGGVSPFVYNYTIINSSSNQIIANMLFLNVPSNTNSWLWTTNSIQTGNQFAANVMVEDSTIVNTSNSTYSSLFQVNPAIITPTITASISPTVSTGQTELFAGSFTGGTPPFTYNYQIINSINGNLVANYLITNAFASNTFSWVVPYNDLGIVVEANVTVIDSATSNVVVNSIYTPAITIGYTPPTVDISPLSDNLMLGNSLTLNATISYGTGPYTYNWLVFNSIGVVSNGLYENSSYNQSTFLFTPNATGNYFANVTITDVSLTTTNSVNSSITVLPSTTTSTTTTTTVATTASSSSTTISATTTISSGAGSGNGGGGGGGGPSKPIISKLGNGYLISNIAQLNPFNLTINGSVIKVTDNFITPVSTGVTVDLNRSIWLDLNQSILVDPVNKIYIELVNISYLPIEHTVTIKVFSNSTTTTSSTTSATTTTQITINTPIQVPPNETNATTTQKTNSNSQISNHEPVSKTNYLLVGAIIFVVILVAGLFSFKFIKKPAVVKKSKTKQRKKGRK
jgi:hypothetical protein